MITIDTTGWQSTSVSRQSSPALQAGNYHIALAVFTEGITVTQTGDQAGACVSGFSPSQIDVEAAGDLTGNVCTNVTTSTPDCVYSIDPHAAWITPRRNVFRGSQQVCFLVSPNPDPTPRSGTVQIGQNAVPLTINQPLGGTIGSPQIPPGAVIPTASGTPAALRGGSLTLGAFFSIFGAEGRDLGPRDRQKAEGYPLSRKLGGVQVEFRRNGVLIDTAFLVFACSQQINGIVPSNEALLGEVDMVVVRNGVASNPRRTTIVRHNAAIFSVLGGRGPAIITNFIAQNNQPLNTRSLTAKPGQAITIWGQGGGRVLFPDQNAPIAGNLPCRQIPSEPGCQEYPFDVEIGGVLLPRPNLFYHGRSTCCSGLDQVVAILGDNVPFGCNVPVRVRAGGPLFGWSNAATMAITPDGSACSTVSNPIANLPATGGNHGTVLLANVDIRQNIDPRRVTADAALATFVAQQAGGDLGFDPILSTQPMGSCVVFDDLQDLSPLLGRTLPKVNLLSGRDYLDAGPQVTFTPPGGAPIVALPRDAVSGEGPYVFPSSFPDTTTQSMFLAGSTQVTIPGGSEVGPANFSVDFPANVTWTNLDQLNSIDRDRPFMFSWSGGRADQEVVAFGLATDQESTATSAFFCRVSADRGGFMVDTPSLTNFLETQGGDLTGKSAYIGIASLPKIPSFFSANGLDLGWALPIKIEIKQVDVTLNGAGPAPATTPFISRMEPTSAAAGGSSTLTFFGSNLQEATGVRFDPATGVTVGSLSPVASPLSLEGVSQIMSRSAQVTIDANAPATARQVSLFSPAGPSNVAAFTITAAPPAGGLMISNLTLDGAVPAQDLVTSGNGTVSVTLIDRDGNRSNTENIDVPAEPASGQCPAGAAPRVVALDPFSCPL